MTRLRIAHAGRLAALLLPGLAVAAGLNDIGVTQCANLTQNGLACPQTSFPRQDAETGRDAQAGLQKAGGGSAGFDFTTLSGGCVRDNVTGRVWEVKTDDNGLRDKDWTYTWYNPDPATNDGNVGRLGSNTCGGFLGNQCNTQAYVTAVNALNPALCGFTDWRMPTGEELRTIVDYSRSNPTIDTGYFPNTVSNWYWSASPDAPDARSAWVVDFGYGDGAIFKSWDYAVRLVRGGQWF